jgi:prepilin-type N-terminal cleavage/methylation domain-containing protein
MRNPRGFTLIELMIVLVIMVIVAGGIYTLLNTTQRLSRAQAERVDLQSNVRTASLLVPNELRELNTFGAAAAGHQNDITAATQTSVRYRAMRGLGFICQTGTTTFSVWKLGFGYRAPAPVQDGAYVFVQSSKSANDIWSPQTITAVSTGNNCPGGVESYTITIAPGVAANPPIGTPVRTYELMEIKSYQQGGQWWLGAQSINTPASTMQPLLGPLRGSDGVDFRYYNSAGVETAVLGDIKSVGFAIWGQTSQNVTKGGGGHIAYVQDSLVTQVSMRNAFRP